MLDTGPVPRGNASEPAQRWVAVAVGLIALAAIAVSLVTREVLVDDWGDGSMQCGLRACETCWGSTCTSVSTIELGEDTMRARGSATAAWGWSGAIAWYAAIVAGAGIVLGVGMVATRRYVRLPVAPTTITLVAAAVALICGCVFVATKPETVGVTEVGWTFWAFGGGVITAIVSAFLLSRQLALIEPEFDPGESSADDPVEPWHDV